MDGIKRAANRVFNFDNVCNNIENNGISDIKRGSKLTRATRQILVSTSSNSDKEEKPEPTIVRKHVVDIQFMNRNEAVQIAKTVLIKVFERSKSKKPLLTTPEEFVDMFSYNRTLEHIRALPPTFITGTSINNKVRQILVDWIMSISSRFSLENETCQLSIAYLDRSILKMKDIQKSQLQLLAAACLYLATKNEEVVMHHSSDFVYMSDNCFTMSDLLKMEAEVFAALNFNANIPVAVTFSRCYRLFGESVNDNYAYARLIVDLAYLDCKLCTKLPSTIALCALYIANYLVGANFDPILLKFNGISNEELLNNVYDFADPLISFIDKNKDCSVRKKYTIRFANIHKNKLISLKSKLQH